MPMDIEDLIETPSFAVCAVGHVVVLVWRQPPAIDGLAETRQRFRSMRDRAPTRKFAFLTIVEPDGTTLNIPADVRDALSAMLKDFQKDIVAAAVVVDAEGFRASLVRTFVATMNLGNRLDFPSTTERNVDAATRWLAARDVALGIDGATLSRAVAKLRARPLPAAPTRRDRVVR